ncbi:MAG: aryl-sulfate sulfotransferase [Lachnospiraceae bacterium]|nr:aryl-sulfate sulfotransferase [Lachnospiraceae bacterium]
MKKTALKALLIMTIISSVFLCVLLVMLVNQGKGDGKTVSKLKEFQEQYEERKSDSKTIAPTVYRDFSKIENEEERYDTVRHTGVYDRIEALKRDGEYTKDAPLVIYNPYGINALSVYVYFETEAPVQVSYRINAQESGNPTFFAECYAAEQYSTVHEYLLLGLTANQNNRVSLVMKDAEGNSCVRTFYVLAGELFGTGKEKLSVGKGVSEEKLSEGLFAHFGNVTGDKEAIQLYDNDGILRGELALLSGSGKRLLFAEDCMYYNISGTQFAAVDRFGRAVRVYSIEGYTIGEDYCLDEGQKKLLVTASRNAEEGKTVSVNDVVLSVDLASGDVKEVFDCGVLLREYKDICKKNEEGVLEWLNLNSIQLLEEGSVLLGAREPSAVLKVKDIYGIPMLDYIIGDSLLFDETGYEDKVLAKEEEFESFFGANTIACVKEEKMPSGVYSLYLYDNHIAGTKSRPDLDYSFIGTELGSSLKKGTSSYFCRYLVNETAGTWQLTERVPVDYSGYMGSAQVTKDGHLITDTAGRFTYSEYDAERNLIRKYTAAGEDYLARVFKYDFKGFFFAGEVSRPAGTTEIK